MVAPRGMQNLDTESGSGNSSSSSRGYLLKIPKKGNLKKENKNFHETGSRMLDKTLGFCKSKYFLCDALYKSSVNIIFMRSKTLVLVTIVASLHPDV